MDTKVVDVKETDCGVHNLTPNSDGTLTARVRVVIYLTDGRRLVADRNIRFARDEIREPE